MISPPARLTAASWDASLFETVVAASVNGVVILDDQGLIRVFNETCEALFHYRSADVVGQGLYVLLAPPFREQYKAFLATFQSTGEASTKGSGRELTAQRKDGSVFPIFLSVGEGVHLGKPMFYAVIQDLTDLQHERAMHAEERAFLAAIVDSSNDAIISKTLDGKITSWNHAAENLFGYRAAEMIGTSVRQLFPADRIHEEEEILEKLTRGIKVEHYETVRLKKDGTLVDVSVTISPICNDNGRVIGASKTVRDITEHKQSEARLHQLSSELHHVARLSEMGHLSAAIAHELNQPLAAILNYTNLAKRLISLNGDAQKALETLNKAGDQAIRAGKIIRGLRDFVEKRDSKRTLEDINAVAEDAVVLGLIGVKSSDFQQELEFARDLPPVMIDRVQIQQVLVNLLRNGAEAMADREQGKLTLTTTLGDDESVIIVRVTDTGTGISEYVSNQLFRPFVTTKAGGMGIGLAISRALVESHGGILSCSPNQGGGSVFQFTLPTAAPTME
ncbi:MAG: PAS domain S-box protein [Rhizomicrobium sp.]|nr:PAS domain S-box protein [Rhizomicrobium sp.]